MRRPRLSGGAWAGVLAAAVLVSACGTRAGSDQVAAGSAAVPLVLPRSEIDRIRTAAAEGAASARPSASLAAEGTAGPGRLLRSTALPAAVTGSGPDLAAAASSGAVRGVQLARPAVNQPATTARKAAAALPASAKAGQRPAMTCDQPGEPLRLGQVGGFSGITGPFYNSARTTLAVWAKDVNARGGVACHPVVLYAQDDGSDSARSASIVQDLVQNKKVVALVANFTVLSVAGFQSAVESMRVPAIGGDVLTKHWNASPYMFPQGGGAETQIRGMLELAVVEEGRKKFGMLYCVETTDCPTNEKMFSAFAESAGGTYVYRAPISLTQPDFTAQCQNAKSAGVDGLILAMDGSAMRRTARSCSAVGFHPLYITSGLIISPDQALDPSLRRDRLLTANMNAPWMLQDLPGQRDFHRALRTWVPDHLPDGPSMAAWASAKLFEAAIATLGEEAKQPITTAMVLQGLGNLRNETLGGLAPPITFFLGQKVAPMIPAVFYDLLTDKGWIAPRGSRLIRLAPVARDGAPAAGRPDVAAVLHRSRTVGR